VLLGGAIILAAVFLAVRGWDNIHTVEAGQMYRSAQLSPKTLEKFIQEQGLRSILNLRGERQTSRWFQQETAVAQAHGIGYYSFKLSASALVAPETLERILDCIDRAAKPMLVHCQGGSDRTGLVVAVWLFAKQRRTPEEAGRHLSLRYGHFPWLWSSTDAMDKSFQNYVAQRGATISRALQP
jgi:undecaprenyl-diphosphatase